MEGHNPTKWWSSPHSPHKVRRDTSALRCCYVVVCSVLVCSLVPCSVCQHVYQTCVYVVCQKRYAGKSSPQFISVLIFTPQFLRVNLFKREVATLIQHLPKKISTRKSENKMGRKYSGIPFYTRVPAPVHKLLYNSNSDSVHVPIGTSNSMSASSSQKNVFLQIVASSISEAELKT